MNALHFQTHNIFKSLKRKIECSVRANENVAPQTRRRFQSTGKKINLVALAVLYLRSYSCGNMTRVPFSKDPFKSSFTNDDDDDNGDDRCKTEVVYSTKKFVDGCRLFVVYDSTRRESFVL